MIDTSIGVPMVYELSVSAYGIQNEYSRLYLPMCKVFVCAA